MKLLKDSDVKTFEQLCGLSQASMAKTLDTYLKSKYKRVVRTKDYIYASEIFLSLLWHIWILYLPDRQVKSFTTAAKM